MGHGGTRFHFIFQIVFRWILIEFYIWCWINFANKFPFDFWSIVHWFLIEFCRFLVDLFNNLLMILNGTRRLWITHVLDLPSLQFGWCWSGMATCIRCEQFRQRSYQFRQSRWSNAVSSVSSQVRHRWFFTASWHSSHVHTGLFSTLYFVELFGLSFTLHTLQGG